MFLLSLTERHFHLQELPSPINFESKTEVHPPSEGKDDDLKIAWRYKNLTTQVLNLMMS